MSGEDKIGTSAIAKTFGNHPKQPANNSLMTTHLSEQDPATLREEYRADPEFATLAQEPVATFTQDIGLLKRGDRTCIPAGTLRTKILHDYHDFPIQGHMGVRKTTKALATKYYWKTMLKDIQSYVQACDPCQSNKAGTRSPLGHRRPLDPPTQRWASVSIDFIPRLPQTPRGHNGIYVFVDRLTKMIRLEATKPDCTAAAVALLFHDHVYRNHGLPKDVVCDHDPVSFSKFLKALTDILKVKIRASPAYHPQTDRQTEIRNKKGEECYATS